MENPNFLKGKYNLHNAPEVKKQAERTEARTGEKVPQDPSSRIQNYLDRFTEILEREDPDKRERGLEAIKRILYRDNIITPDSGSAATGPSLRSLGILAMSSSSVFPVCASNTLKFYSLIP